MKIAINRKTLKSTYFIEDYNYHHMQVFVYPLEIKGEYLGYKNEERKVLDLKKFNNKFIVLESVGD